MTAVNANKQNDKSVGDLKVKVKVAYSSYNNRKPITELRSVTCHMGSYSVVRHATRHR